MSFHETELQDCREFLLRLARWCISHITSDSYARLTKKQRQIMIDRINTFLDILKVLSDIQEEVSFNRGKTKC